MTLYVDGKKIGEVVPGSVRIRLVGGSRDGEELIEGKDFLVNCKTATITFTMDSGNEVLVSYPASRKHHLPKGKKKKADWKQPRYGRKP